MGLKERLLFQMLGSEALNLRVGKPLAGALPPPAFASMMRTATKQTVTGLVCSGFVHCNVELNKYDAAKVFFTLRKLEEDNHKINAELAALSSLLGSRGIKFVVVKGQTIACRYPYPDTREPGDIDFYCDADNFEAARRILVEEWKVEFEDEDDDESDQHITFTRNDVFFEMHFCLYKFASKRLQRIFNRMVDEAGPAFVEVGGERIPVLPPSVNITYTFLHLWHHLVELGVGLRQFCDLAVLLKELYESDDREEQRLLAVNLERLGFTKAFEAVACVLVETIGLPRESFPVALRPRGNRYVAPILDIVFRRGNFGQYGRKERVRSGWRYYVESMRIKLSHYVRFYLLAPRENTAVILKSIPARVVMAFRRQKDSRQ